MGMGKRLIKNKQTNNLQWMAAGGGGIFFINIKLK